MKQGILWSGCVVVRERARSPHLVLMLVCGATGLPSYPACLHFMACCFINRSLALSYHVIMMLILIYSSPNISSVRIIVIP